MPSGPDRAKAKPSAAPRPPGMSLFRPGQPRHDTEVKADVTLDQRTGREIFLTPTGFAAPHPALVWSGLTQIQPDPAHLAAHNLYAIADRDGPASYFDMLRTKVAQALAQKDWRRIAVTSPGKGCGKSFVASNLALALARLPACRTVLMDLDLRAPRLASLFGQTKAPALAGYLQGDQAFETQFCRMGAHLALGLNGQALPHASETLQDPESHRALQAMQDLLQPDAVIFDTPALLHSDDVLSLTGMVDAVLLVSDGTKTAPRDILACERMLEGKIPLLAVVLNRAQDRGLGQSFTAQR